MEIFFVVLTLAGLFSATQSFSQELKLEVPGKSRVVDLRELKKTLQPAVLTVKDPVYHKDKTYEGFWLADVLKAGGLEDKTGDELVFHCKDGYSPTLPFSRLAERKALLAWREKGRKGNWEKFHQGKAEMTPAPYYLVWENAASGQSDHAAEERFPWPYQLVGIEVVDFKRTYSRLYPADQAASSRGEAALVMKGFETFRTQCLRCHSINLQGGVLGPELNYPKNVTEYWDEKNIAAFVRNPGTFRARSKMPAFPLLVDERMKEVLAYLHWARDHKQADNAAQP